MKFFCAIKPLKTRGFGVNHGTCGESLAIFNGFIQTQVIHENYDIGNILLLETTSLKDQYLLHERLEAILAKNEKIRTLEELAEILESRYPGIYVTSYLDHHGLKK
jgi:hypothetical protein